MERDLKTLLELVLSRKLFRKYFETGLCYYLKNLVRYGYISEKEEGIIFRYLAQYRREHKMQGWEKNPAYWFKRNNVWRRRRFLRRVLKQLD